MPVRYTFEELLVLKDSPLCVKPTNLPAAQEWMGPPPDITRPQTSTKVDRSRGLDAALLDQTNRRPGLDRQFSRGNQNAEDIVLGPPRTSFASATSMRGARPGEGDKGGRDGEGRERTSYRSTNKTAESEGNDRFRERETRTANTGGSRRGTDADQDSEGWSTVKPRKSFGHEGAERFHGRMGGGDRYSSGRDDRRAKDREERGEGDRRSRNLDNHGREKEAEEVEGSRRNGLNRGRSDPWFKDSTEGSGTTTTRERIDRAKSWRDRNPDERPEERRGERASDRNFDRRWDRERDQRVEREPEWLDEPAEGKSQGHTEEDFKKFMEAMKASRAGPSKAGDEALEPKASVAELGKDKVQSAPAVESGPDKFFAAFGVGSKADLGSTNNASGEPNESPAAAAAAGGAGSKAKPAKPSRFTSFFSASDDGRGKTEPPTPAAALGGAAPPNGTKTPSQQSDADKEAFQALLQKLQTQTQAQHAQHVHQQAQILQALAGGPPPSAPPAAAGPFAEPPPPHMLEARQRTSAVTSPEPFQQQHYGGDRREEYTRQEMHADLLRQEARPDARQDPRLRAGPPSMGPDMMGQPPRAMPPPPQQQQQQPPPGLSGLPPLAQQHLAQRAAGRQEQLMQELMGQPRHLAQNPGRADQTNAEFLMQLMQRARNAPEPMRTEQQMMLRMPQPSKQQMAAQQLQEREQHEYHMRERRQQLRSPNAQPGGGFVDGSGPYGAPDVDARQQQPTQILQRPHPPPGLDHHAAHAFAGAGGGGGGGPPPQPGLPPRTMIPPPPGLANSLRNVNAGPPPQMPPQQQQQQQAQAQPPQQPLPGMFPPNFPAPGAFSALDSGAGGGGPPPPQLARNMQPPPGPPPAGFFQGPPPPGFMGPPGMGGGFPPDGLAFGGPPPFDARGMPPPPPGAGGLYRRA